MENIFQKEVITEGINLYLYQTKKYKTVSFRVFLYNKADEDITKTALIPFVLARGTENYRDNLTIRKNLANLYGAQLASGVTRRGDAILLDFRLEMVSPKFVKEKNYLAKGLDILKEVIFNPFTIDEGFNPLYVDGEKENIKNRILAVLNDKGRYAFERAIQLMCPNDPYRFFKYGKLEDLPQITPQNLYGKYKEIVENCPIDVFVVGDFEKEEIIKIIKGKFNYPRKELKVLAKPKRVEFLGYKEEVEEMEVNQGKLVMGLKTPITLEHPLYPALLMYNGILGAYPHSKLFKNVRENASLAYYTGSNLEGLKGLVFIFAGIEAKTFQQTIGIIKEQLEDLKKGNISEKEFQYTYLSLESSLLETYDEVGGQIGYFVDGNLVGKKMTIPDLIESLKKVNIEDVVEVAKSVELELIYFLKGKGGE
ncbi:Predicted Zn-dependent peptidase [Anaerobranca californiensis DSM 14826]|jgi:predicted Zn-dependent peptidase|uniref:Predicted Zn-dependent peptidase n=1 Tax=Anaerobranca californiensis DSM 14826 TaxID=1120989 RepID=A0A1M6PQ60_9FIRM|nr:pitrilysin family protein [Anaerobranca californiensis]SHK10100.1 Predicted Zn-dependent peptidase [Anaerobranca californiensis DSM 14826]